MAYAATISLKRTIRCLPYSPPFSSNKEILRSAYEEVKSLQQVLERLNGRSSSSERLNALDGQIRDAVHKLEDALELHDSESHELIIRQEITSFLETAKKMEEEYTKELDNPSLEEDTDGDDDAVVGSPSNITDVGAKSYMVGLCDEYNAIRGELLEKARPDDFAVVSFVGMAGTCRTLTANYIFAQLCNDQDQSFDCSAWVTIGPNYQFTEVVKSVLAQVVEDPAIYDDIILRLGGDETKLGEEHLHAILKGRRYLIAVDDVRDVQMWSELKSLFPEQNNGSLVLMTTGLEEVAKFACPFYICRTLLNSRREIQELLHRMIFFDEACPPELEEAEKKIAENCQGLSLPPIKICAFVCLAEEPLEALRKLAADKENPIFKVDDEILEMHKTFEDIQLCNSISDDDKRRLYDQLALMLNFSQNYEEIKQCLFPETLFPKMKIISLLGMAGIGKSSLAKKIFEDPLILRRFDHHVWVTLGPKYKSKEILVDIHTQIYPNIDKMHKKGNAELAKNLCAQLSDKSCLIVLDDVWNKEPLHYIKKLLPDIKGKALLTTRLAKVEQFGNDDIVYKIRLLNEEESWSLFCQNIFAKGSCPFELHKAGKKISEQCEGLPLMIIKVADLLSKAEKTPEYWNKVAEKQNSVFMEAHGQMSKTLLPSYNSLPQHLKACFLYMGVFSQKYEIPASELTNLWIAEGFLEPDSAQTIEAFAAECLLEIVERSLVMGPQKGFNSEMETCILHSVFWYLSNSEAAKNKFFHALTTFADNSTECIMNQRRLCVRNNLLLGIKDVRTSVASNSIARSLLCTGLPYQYPVPIHFGLRLLRVLYASAIRFYEFPIEVVGLIHLIYLALICNAKLPISISKLQNLEYLIISQHLSIKSSKDSPYLPVEIWEMKKLKHLQVMGKCLPNPNHYAVLPNLSTVLNLSAHSCTGGVLRGIRNIKKLGIQIELAPDDDNIPFDCLNRISRLNELESLECVVVNPSLRSEVVALPTPFRMFPSGLKKLSLSGLGYPWEYTKTIAELQNLEMLNLQCYAFRGANWETGFDSFLKLKFLLIEDTDLVNWEPSVSSLKELECVSIKHCYQLVELPNFLSGIVRMIEVVDSNPLVVAWAKHIEEENSSDLLNLRTFKLDVHSSWESGSLIQ